QEIINELTTVLQNFSNKHQHKFFVLSSSSKSVFSFGGDLKLFSKLIREQNKPALYFYMKQCIETLYSISQLPGCERIALVRGTAFGGGFEAALACDTIIAEKNAKFGFPDRLFNSFPGMGAYSYLTRRIEPTKAQQMIKSAKTYSAEELYDMGIVDKLVADGDGYDAVYSHIQNYNRYSNSFNALKQVFQSINPVNYDELLQIGELWVNTAMKLSEKDLGLMKRLAASQANLVAR
ncbi:MAG: crotonase/enoyl-CoA hydratase family protein, partial [Gammaproteobacteria bacterium]|nr:crotonase/enoyl-CoA hydratase family protein [Gammaproteobacteria bacterium]